MCTDDLQEQNKLGKLCHSVQSAYRNYICPVDALAQNKILTSYILLFILSKLKNVSKMILLPTQFLFRCRGEGVINKISFIMYSEV